MKNLEKLVKIIKDERNYDKSFSIDSISKSTDNIVTETAIKYDIEKEMAVELLINIGGMYIDEYDQK